jgi:hypothetical protein
MKYHILILISFSICITIASVVQAQNSSKLLGDRWSEENSVKGAGIIAIGQFKSLGEADVDSEENSYSGAVVEISRVLKGRVGKEIKTTYALRSTAVAVEKEASPEIGVEYIFFLESGDATVFQIIKLLKATNERVAKIQALIAAESAGK